MKKNIFILTLCFVCANNKTMHEFSPRNSPSPTSSQESTSSQSTSSSTDIDIQNILQSLQPDTDEEQHPTEPFNPFSLTNYPYGARQEEQTSTATPPQKSWYERFFCCCDSQ